VHSKAKEAVDFWLERSYLASNPGAPLFPSFGKNRETLQQWKSQTYRQARAERSAIESLVFTLKEGLEFGEMVRRTHENVLAEMLEKVLAYNISQIIRVRKKLSEPQQMQQAAA
jgi:hypothetical protein